jgi:hypothetical protein
MGIESLAAWLRSVKEAKVYQSVLLASMKKSAKKFFQPQQRPKPPEKYCASPSQPCPLPSGTSTTALPHSRSHATQSDNLNLRLADYDPG